MVMTLPAGMLLGSSERQAVERHVAELERVLGSTPAESATVEAEMLVVVSKMMLALPGQRATEAGAEATGEAYCAALDDLPPWAVLAALRRWYRGDVAPMPKFQQQHNFNFRPSPATLRAISFREAGAVRGRVIELRRLLEAEARAEYSEEHRGEMLAKLQTVMPSRNRVAAE